MIKKLRAFTLAETMVTLAIMSVLASVMLPIVGQIRPDRNKSLFKKAYYVAERVIYDMVTNESLYPSMGSYVGFDNTESATYMGNTFSGETKFCNLFAYHVNRTSYSYNYCSSGSTTLSFTTTDGIAWYLPRTNFKGLTGTETPENAALIIVDVNGSKGPNEFKKDKFKIYVQADGRVFTDGEIEKKYQKSSTPLKED